MRAFMQVRSSRLLVIEYEAAVVKDSRNALDIYFKPMKKNLSKKAATKLRQLATIT